MQPGDVVGPGGNEPNNQEKPAEQPVVEQVVAPVANTPPSEEAAQPENNWQFTDDGQASPAPLSATHDTVSWTASEYIAHEKSGSWYILLATAVIGSAGVVYLITQEVVSVVVILIMGAAFGSFAARKPQELTYVLDNSALKIGEKSYPYAQFKSFTIVDEGAISSIMLMPLQRFMPPLSVYYDPSDEDKITDALSAYLPYEDRKPDPVDRLMRKVRF